MSYSPSAVSADRRAWSWARLGASPRSKLPASASVTRTPIEDFHPVSPRRALVHVPRGDLHDFVYSLFRAHPFEHPGSPCRAHSLSTESLSRSPPLPPRARLHGIESGDYSWRARDYFQKPPSNRTSTSRCNPALRATRMTGVTPSPLPGWWPGFPAARAQLDAAFVTRFAFR